MKKYRQLTFGDRVYIEVLNAERKSKQEIADRLGCDVTTVWREYRRGTTSRSGYMLDHCYGATKGEKQRVAGARRRGRKPKIVGKLAAYVREKIQLNWSPEQISGRLKLEGLPTVSHETIYAYLAKDKGQGGRLYLHLRWSRRKRRKRFGVPRVRADLVNRKSIEERPAKINDRLRVGDWERDLVFGSSRSTALLTAVDRVSLFTLIRKVSSKSPREIAEVTFSLFGPGKMKCHSLTNDNGFEFRNHESESERLQVPIYFTHPYSSWEKGTNENTNGLIRQYFSPQTNMEKFTDEHAKKIEEALNTRPRKKLGYRTPEESFFERKIALFS